MNTIKKRANFEVLVILNKFNLIDKIPEQVLLSMKQNQDENWNFVYDDNLELEEQKITKETAILLSSIYLRYICENQEEREELKKIYEENEKNKRQNYSDVLAELANDKKAIDENENENVQLVSVEQDKNTVWKRIKAWFKRIIGK